MEGGLLECSRIRKKRQEFWGEIKRMGCDSVVRDIGGGERMEEIGGKIAKEI